MVDKREIVRKLLCMPIVKSNKKGIIRITEDDKIETSQSYKSHFDPDMSDVAVEFYKILYGIDVLLKQENHLSLQGIRYVHLTQLQIGYRELVKVKNKEPNTTVGQIICKSIVIFIIVLQTFGYYHHTLEDLIRRCQKNIGG